ncbi:MAG: ferredoxin [Phycisphaerae bacterium]|nr:ferredoxin [Phycisphaerae bacterium]
MAKYKVEIDRETCIGCQACASDAAGTFEMDDDDIAIVVNQEGDPPETILAAAEACPSESIILHDADTGEKVYPAG